MKPKWQAGFSNVETSVMHETDIQKKLEAISKNETDIQKKSKKFQ